MCQLKCASSPIVWPIVKLMVFVCMSQQVPQVTDGDTTVPWLLSWQEWPLASITFTGYVSPYSQNVFVIWRTQTFSHNFVFTRVCYSDRITVITFVLHHRY